jgi:mannose-6-phosphate isomerase-like protein (cupin superfamily)
MAITGFFERTNIDELLAPLEPRKNMNIISLDDDNYSVRVAKIKGRFPWHSHPHGDEGWLVWKGRMRLESADRSVELGPGDFTVIPRGTVHSPIVLEEGTVVIIFNRTQLGMDLVDESVDLGGFELPPESRD